jgi:hypothetical protein
VAVTRGGEALLEREQLPNRDLREYLEQDNPRNLGRKDRTEGGKEKGRRREESNATLAVARAGEPSFKGEEVPGRNARVHLKASPQGELGSEGRNTECEKQCNLSFCWKR